MREKINRIAELEEDIAMAGGVLLNISRDEDQRARLLSEYKGAVDFQSKMVQAKREDRLEGEKKRNAEFLDLIKIGVVVLVLFAITVGKVHAQGLMVQGIDWGNPNTRVSRHFTVSDIFTSPAGIDWNRHAALFALLTAQRDIIISNILAMATRMDEVWDRYGRLHVTSWYRDAETNRRVGGAANSQHMQGNAVDFMPLERNGLEVQNSLEAHWSGGVGRGFPNRNFIHLDLGTRRRWDY